MEFTMKRTLGSSYEAALEQVPAALKTEGFGILTEIDVKDTLKKKIGADFRRYKILGACNPALALEALSTRLDIGAMLPCNVVVYEGDDGHAVVHAIDPVATVASADPALIKLASTVHDKLAKVLEQLK